MALITARCLTHLRDMQAPRLKLPLGRPEARENATGAEGGSREASVGETPT